MMQDRTQGSKPDLSRIKANIASMIDQGAQEREIDQYLSSEGVSADQLSNEEAPIEVVGGTTWPDGTPYNGPDSRPLAVPPQKPASFLQGAGEGALNVLNHVVDWAEEIPGVDAIQKFGADNFGMARDNQAAVDEQNRIGAGMNTRGSGLGKFVGETAAMLPLAAIPGGPLVQGSLAGSLMSDSNTALGVAQDAGLGAVTAKAGDSVVRGLANRFAPQAAPAGMNDSLRTLYEAGVSVTPGQAARTSANPVVRSLAAFEDRANRQPIVGDMIDSGRRRGAAEFATATINRALEPIGLTVPKSMSGRNAISYAGNKLSDAYESVTRGIGKFNADDQFVNDLASIQEQAAEMLPQRAEQLNSILKGVGRFFGDDGTSLDGAALKNIETRLTQRIGRLMASTDADQHDLAEALDMARSAVRDLAGRAYPDFAAELQAINQGWASLVQVERAALTGKGGAISPNSYSNAVKATNATTRHRGYARGEALNQDLADAASEVLPSEIADSGTASRTAQANLLGLATGAAYSVPYGLASIATRGSRVPPAPGRAAPTPIQGNIAALLRYAAQGSPAATTAAPALVSGNGQ